jgi:hypothetical protein
VEAALAEPKCFPLKKKSHRLTPPKNRPRRKHAQSEASKKISEASSVPREELEDVDGPEKEVKRHPESRTQTLQALEVVRGYCAMKPAEKDEEDGKKACAKARGESVSCASAINDVDRGRCGCCRVHHRPLLRSLTAPTNSHTRSPIQTPKTYHLTTTHHLFSPSHCLCERKSCYRPTPSPYLPPTMTLHWW